MSNHQESKKKCLCLKTWANWYLLIGLLVNNTAYLLLWGSIKPHIRSILYGILSCQLQRHFVAAIIISSILILTCWIAWMLLDHFVVKKIIIINIKKYAIAILGSFLIVEVILQFFAGQGIKALFDFVILVIFAILFLLERNYLDFTKEEYEDFLRTFCQLSASILFGGLISISLILPKYYDIIRELQTMLKWYMVIGFVIVVGFLSIVVVMIDKIRK